MIQRLSNTECSTKEVRQISNLTVQTKIRFKVIVKLSNILGQLKCHKMNIILRVHRLKNRYGVLHNLTPEVSVKAISRKSLTISGTTLHREFLCMRAFA